MSEYLFQNLCRPPMGTPLHKLGLSDRDCRMMVAFIYGYDRETFEVAARRLSQARIEKAAELAARQAAAEQLAARRAEAAEFERAEAIYHAAHGSAETIRTMMGGAGNG